MNEGHEPYPEIQHDYDYYDLKQEVGPEPTEEPFEVEDDDFRPGEVNPGCYLDDFDQDWMD